MSVKLSIIVPVYNLESCISKCLDTLINQTIEDKEIIVINDASKDNSGKIINNYSNQYGSLIKFIDLKENVGPGQVRNIGIESSNGRYIAFVDGDDFVDIDMYKILYDTAERYKSDIVSCSYERIKPDQKNTETRSKEVINLKELSSMEAVKGLLIGSIDGFAWNKLYKRSLFIQNNIKFPRDMYYEDMEVAIQAASKCNKFISIDNKFYYYVDQQNSIVNTLNDKKLKDFCLVTKNIDKYVKNKYKLDLNSSLLDFNIRAANYKSYIYYQICKNKEDKFNYIELDNISKYNSYKIRQVLSVNTLSIKEKVKFILLKAKLYHKVVSKLM